MRNLFELTRFTLLSALVVYWLCGCSRGPNEQNIGGDQKQTGIVSVYVVNYPLAYFAQRIGNKHVQVVFPAPADEDPAFWTPDAETISRYQNADLILLNGASYAKWTSTVSLPALKLVDTSAAVSDQYVQVEGAVRHTHGPGGDHSHGGTAFTTWLDPKLALAQAEAIRQALVAMRPQHERTFQENFSALERDLNELDAKISELVDKKNDHPLVFSHPVYQYLARRYNLNASSVHWEPEELPSQEMWERFQKLLQEHPAKWMVWESEPSKESVAKLKQLGVESIVFDPCGNVPQDGDYLQVMQQNLDRLARAFSSDPADFTPP